MGSYIGSQGVLHEEPCGARNSQEEPCQTSILSARMRARSSYYPQKIVHTAVCLQALAYGLKKEPGGFSQEESGGPKRSQ